MQNINKITNKLLELLNNGTQFVGEQLPDVATQYINYYFINNLFVLGGFTILLVLGIYLVVKPIKYYKKNINTGDIGELEGNLIACSIASGFLVIVIAIFPIIGAAKESFQLYYTPKAYIIEKLRKECE